MTAARSSGLSGEDRLIARHFKPLVREPGALGLTDDTALLRLSRGHELVLTCDAVVGGIHFLPHDPPGAVAQKALRVNLSDLAAKGAKPAGFLLTLALPKGVDSDWLKPFAAALSRDSARYGCPLLGGDTVRTRGPVCVSIAAFGSLPAGTMVKRSGARRGDHVVVSGTIGDAVLGLRLRSDPLMARRWRLTARQRRELIGRFLVPQPRNALAEAVRACASAAMDVSDGLVGDLGKLCRASGVGAVIEATRVPLSNAAAAALRADRRLLPALLSGGDDYEILATVPPGRLAAFKRRAQSAGVRLTVIGRVVGGRGVRVLDADGRPLSFTRASFSHF